ncbi:hypothetical protein EXN66_Car011883 [Channa argus]|uniref:Uncharacterized protein n=1 Tax=Channa argus TaxID=215402 RepID=A0A6G1Q125_CHAAH|nr:hypothetical protein EXN66_Car011883 [Channa argus]
MGAMEEELRKAEKITVLGEQEFWQQDREQLLEENRRLQRKLCIMTEDNKKLYTELQKAKEERGGEEEEISSLPKRLFPLEKNFSTALFISRRLKSEVAEEERKKREQLINSLQQRLCAEKQETERARALFHQCSGLETGEEKWRRKVSKLEELLTEKDKALRRAIKKRQARTRAYVDILAELTKTTSALKQSHLTCVALEGKLQTMLASGSFRKELSNTGNSFRQQLLENSRKEGEGLHKDLSYKDIKSRMEPVELCELWQSKAQNWNKEKMELEEEEKM